MRADCAEISVRGNGMKKPSIDLNALKAAGWRPLVAVLCALLGFWMLWKAYSVYSDQRLTETVRS